jgi:hypothetical protein
VHGELALMNVRPWRYHKQSTYVWVMMDVEKGRRTCSRARVTRLTSDKVCAGVSRALKSYAQGLGLLSYSGLEYWLFTTVAEGRDGHMGTARG